MNSYLYKIRFTIFSILLLGLAIYLFQPNEIENQNEAILLTDLQANKITMDINDSGNDILELNCSTNHSFQGTITVLNVIGSKLKEWQNDFVEGDQKVTVDVSQLVAGQYVIAVSDGNQSIAKKIVLNNEHP